jgi:hypothetical protein
MGSTKAVVPLASAETLSLEVRCKPVLLIISAILLFYSSAPSMILPFVYMTFRPTSNMICQTCIRIPLLYTSFASLQAKARTIGIKARPERT